MLRNCNTSAVSGEKGVPLFYLTAEREREREGMPTRIPELTKNGARSLAPGKRYER